VPHPTTLIKLVGRAGPEVVQELNAALLAKLAGDRLLRARKLRIDTTVVEADIDYPTDADLQEQAVRKLGGLVRRVKGRGAASRTRFRDRGRAAGRRMKQLARTLRRRTGVAMAEVDRLTGEVAGIARQSLGQVQLVVRNAHRTLARRPEDGRLGRLVGELAETIGATERLLAQTDQRLAGNRVIPDRLVSLSDPTPGTVVGDRGFGTAANDQALQALGVNHIGLQRNGTPGKARLALERTRAFRRLRNWRVGIEARISHLKRSFGLRRTRLRRLLGARSWVGLGIFAYNLQRMTGSPPGDPGAGIRRPPPLSRPLITCPSSGASS
jgi:IS5 family transposase